MAKFEVVSKYESADLVMPVRKTQMSAGYDLAAADDYIIPSVFQLASEAEGVWAVDPDEFVTLE